MPKIRNILIDAFVLALLVFAIALVWLRWPGKPVAPKIVSAPPPTVRDDNLKTSNFNSPKATSTPQK